MMLRRRTPSPQCGSTCAPPLSPPPGGGRPPPGGVGAATARARSGTSPGGRFVIPSRLILGQTPTLPEAVGEQLVVSADHDADGEPVRDRRVRVHVKPLSPPPVLL